VPHLPRLATLIGSLLPPSWQQGRYCRGKSASRGWLESSGRMRPIAPVTDGKCELLRRAIGVCPL